MPAPRGNKRARADTMSAESSGAEESEQHSTENLDSILAAMTSAMRTKLLAKAATRHPDVMASITAWNDKKLAREAAKMIIDFDALAEETWNIIDEATHNVAGDMGRDEAYKIACGVIAKVKETLKTIAKSVVRQSKFETKYNAIEAIRDISVSLVTRPLPNIVSKVMREDYFGLDKLGLVPVLKTFSEEELKQLVKIVLPATEETGGRSLTWFEKFKELDKECMAYYVEYELGTGAAMEVLQAAKNRRPSPH